jgi:N-acetylneuraminate synthase/N,N'-diacetyllegionaminate synthase
VYVIAEIGVNHDGSLDKAIQLVDVAKVAGADCAKFQIFKSELVVAKGTPSVDYQRVNTSVDDQLDLIRPLELPVEAWRVLSEYCQHVEIDFAATAFDLDSLSVVIQQDPAFLKVPSGEITNNQLLDAMPMKDFPVLVSTGMATADEVAAIAQRLRVDRDVLFHCVTDYPAPLSSWNLLSIPFLRSLTGLHVGWSDHSIELESALLSLGLGARIFERHITLDTNSPGPDHRASSDPDAFRRYVRALGDAMHALGSPGKQPTAVEEATRPLVRRGWYAARRMPAGHSLEPDDVVALRPVGSLSASIPVVGRMTQRVIEAGEALREDDLSPSRKAR